MSSAYVSVLILAFLSGLTTLIGAILALYLKENTKAIAVGIGFSAGIMVLISVCELIPESLASGSVLNTLVTTSLGVLLMAFLNYIIPHTHLVKEDGHLASLLLKSAYLAAFGLVLHDFPEGFAMANSYLVSPNLGLLVALAIALHNIPEEFAVAVPFVLINKGRAFLFKIAFVSGLAEPLGASVGLLAASLNPTLTPLFLSFAAGAMIFVSLHELLPMAKLYGREKFFVLGIILSVFVYLGLTVLIPE